MLVLIIAITFIVYTDVAVILSLVVRGSSQDIVQLESARMSRPRLSSAVAIGAISAAIWICCCWLAIAFGLTSDAENNTIVKPPFDWIFNVGLFFSIVALATGSLAFVRRDRRRLLTAVSIIGGLPGGVLALLFMYTAFIGPIRL